MEHDFPLDRLDPRRLVYISFGTHHDPGLPFYRACVDAFRDLDVQVLLLLSPATDPAEFGPVPPHFMVRKTGGIPQLEVLQKTRLFLSHAGGNAVRESLWFGVPALMVPQTYEQDLLARRIESQGAGLRLPQQKATAARIKTLAQKMLAAPSYRERSRAIGDSARAAGGARRAVDLILDYVKR